MEAIPKSSALTADKIAAVEADDVVLRLRPARRSFRKRPLSWKVTKFLTMLREFLCELPKSLEKKVQRRLENLLRDFVRHRIFAQHSTDGGTANQVEVRKVFH